jgi:FtsX-like permease family
MSTFCEQLVAYSVACRTREIGIRMAIGAFRSDVLTMVLRQGFALSAAGIAVGAIASHGDPHRRGRRRLLCPGSSCLALVEKCPVPTLFM